MKKFYLILAAAAGMTLASCTNSEFVGEAPVQQDANGAISFGGGAGKMTRADATGAAAATLLNSQMKVYGVKQNRTTTTNYDKVFVDYTVQYNTSKAGNQEYNGGWYYAGIGSQDIKYWDWASADYHFAAGSPLSSFADDCFTLNGTTGDIETATVTGLGGHLNHTVKNASATPSAVYIADPKVVAKAAYNNEVEFTFRSMQSKVRVGIYETIPGYQITSIQFYNNATPTPGASNYITLNGATAGYFQGGTAVTGTVTYNWATPAYTFTYDSGLTSGNYWEGGAFSAGVPATNSAATNLYGAETDMGTTGYFVVMPTPSATAAQALTLTCDYTLTSLDGSGETINVAGATATIPADYTKWVANTAYTYLFKITESTNGKTDPSQPNVGLYPIVFDAVVVDFEDNKVGTETTVSTPSITVYQNGDVVTNGITYVAGSVDVKAYEGTSDITSTATWSYVELTSYTYGTDYERLGASGAATSWTAGALTTVTAGKTYVIKAVGSATTAYFVLVVGAAENGPANS